MIPAGTELLDTVARLLGSSGAGVDPVPAAARVAWSAIVEPGDSVAGELLAGLGPERALGAVLLAADGEFDALLGGCVEAEVPGAEDPAVLLGVLQTAVERWRPRLAVVEVGDVLTAAGAVGAALLVPESEGWPSAMDDLGPHAPVVLWSRSSGTCLGDGLPALGVVGSRANTVAGAEAAAEITSTAADAGCRIVSGGAYGIDAVAHRVAVAAGTPTVAVLAGGIDQLYPVGNAQLLHNVARQGALLAESAPGTRPTRWRFLAQNVKSMRRLRMRSMTTDDAASDGAEKPETIEEVMDVFHTYMALIDQDDDGDTGVVHVLPDALIQEMIAIVEAKPTEADIQHYAAIGQFISTAAHIEKRMQSLGAFLLNPEPHLARPAMRALTARNARELVATLLVPQWPDTRRLIAELERIAAMRNKLAHNPVSSFHLSEDETAVIQEYRLTFAKQTKTGVEPVTIAMPIELVREWDDRARIAHWMVGQVLTTLAMRLLHEEMSNPVVTLDHFFQDAFTESSTTIGEHEKELFEKFWPPLN
ncbi:hypothetical protein DEJ17_09780 [Curtobacterium sp. MCSS17_011]|uniref:DNA-processing protein DprA n=1 Tax=Curtobacterium sp. MCSS17_011 TaxID=2175643 RepID=UPI000D98B65C|nr:DNA-processing protein DprA [Curtobacterium sp. MCSS17_011]PYY57780.1 hypothetical protein DEJ17_09780 [Curtobacterium sp. MCSS17_011]